MSSIIPKTSKITVKKIAKPTKMEAVSPGKKAMGCLEKLCSKKGIEYELVAKEGTEHKPLFTMCVTVGDDSATGKGPSKKEAKHAAAKAYLNQKQGLPKGQSGPSGAASTNNVPSPSSNLGGELEELAQSLIPDLDTFTSECDSTENMGNIEAKSCTRLKNDQNRFDLNKGFVKEDEYSDIEEEKDDEEDVSSKLFDPEVWTKVVPVHEYTGQAENGSRNSSAEGFPSQFGSFVSEQSGSLDKSSSKIPRKEDETDKDLNLPSPILSHIGVQSSNEIQLLARIKQLEKESRDYKKLDTDYKKLYITYTELKKLLNSKTNQVAPKNRQGQDKASQQRNRVQLCSNPERPHYLPERRDIIVDGANVAMAHGLHKFYSCEGVRIVVKWFVDQEYNIKVVIRGQISDAGFITVKRPLGTKAEDVSKLRDLYDKDFIMFTPPKSYDDIYLFRLAKDEGIIVSNDQFRDLLKIEPSWRNTIEKRVLNYAFAGNDFMPPDDPLGRYGPTLDEFLKK